jgi:HEAT repeat protein
MESTTPTGARQGRRGRIAPIFLAALLVVGLSTQIGNLRAHWWAYRLGRAEDPAAQALCLGQIAALGNTAAGALNRIATSYRAELRRLAIPASQGLDRDERTRLLVGLVGDTDADIRLSAANALAFMDRGDALSSLLDLVGARQAGMVSAAAAGLARVPGTEAVDALCDAVREHEFAVVRAQAVESLVQHLKHATPGDATDGVANEPFAEAFARALADDGRFGGQLALEREITDVSAAVAARTSTKSALRQASSRAAADRSVREVTADLLFDLTGRRFGPVSADDSAAVDSLAEQIEAALSRRQDTHGEATPHGLSGD